ncbi:MAG: hypothetical protein GF355_00350 [Candidatus Eisenbacteria bacterium]|nr:hypothetical protein [Candidatus Eisenbacteria bacterium]
MQRRSSGAAAWPTAIIGWLFLTVAADGADAPPRRIAYVDSLLHPRETHLINLRQLTFDGENAEAYFSSDGTRLVFQRTPRGGGCDQIYVMDVDSGEARIASTGKGRTTCAYFLQDDRNILYASTHLAGEDCPPPPDYSQGYVWALYPGYEIFKSRPDGSGLQRLTTSPGYDAEATVAPDGRTIVFTSVRDGDLELYTMQADGSGVQRLTHTLGYDGGAFYSHDGRRICFRASRPETERERDDYLGLLKEGLIRPGRLELFVMNADGSDLRQVTELGAATFCPFFFPDDERLIFASNFHSEEGRGRNFDLFAVGVDGEGLERITHFDGFDGFPMFSPDGGSLVFASNRGQEQEGETNIFLADWVE